VLATTASAQYVLTPPYFNIAENRPITANATCGEGGVGKESYCKLVGGFDRIDETWGMSKDIIDGQVCDFCISPSRANEDGIDITKTHGPKNANDGDISTWWQSPPISRGRKYNRVDLEIDLLQNFQVAYVVVTMADSPRPGVWALEKSMDNGNTWTPWQYFASNDAECQKFFGIHAHGMHANARIDSDDSVICATEFSKVLPIEGGEIFVPLTKGRPSENNIQQSEVMMNWLTATNIRIRLMQTKTMLGHLMSVAQGDNTVTRRYYYAIKEISVGGRCVCNGHAYICPPVGDTNILQCECKHKTSGLNCDQCMDGFTQKKWRRYTSDDRFECEPCNCNGHSSKCHFNQTVNDLYMSMDVSGNYEGGGVCEECEHFTTGINCDSCVDGFFRPPGVLPDATEPCIPCDCPDPRHTGNCAPDSGMCECKEAFRGAEDCSSCAQGYYDYPDCKPCACFPNGTLADDNGIPVCTSVGEELQCPCKDNFGGEFCDECAEGYFNFPECTPCECNPQTSENEVCDPENGQCRCQAQYGERTCEQCNHGFYYYPDCISCNCDAKGSVEEICDKDQGDCICKEGYGGERCDKCEDGWFGYPNCEPCECSSDGSTSSDGICEPTSGQCPCQVNFGGRKCDQCTPGYYNYPNCFTCGCDSVGSNGMSCTENGVCDCKENFVGEKCDECAAERFNYPLCEECNCDPDGVTENFFIMGGCASVPKGELCDCKEAVTGRTCNLCKPLFWNLKSWNPEGCEQCGCNRDGTIGSIGVCDQNDGQCACKAAVGGETDAGKCTECMDGYYGLSSNNMLGCDDCKCDLGGSVYVPGYDPVCDKDDGQCQCRNGMIGRTCDQVESMHYIPGLYQYQFEIEDGYRMDGSPVRFDYKQARFPQFSWRGYAGFSPLQDEVLQDVSITQASTYNTVLRYQNPNEDPITGTVTIFRYGYPDEQAASHKVILEPTNDQPSFVTVSGELNLFPSPFDLEPDQYTVKLEIDNKDPESKEVLIDYFVLLPNEYVKPRILKQDIKEPCKRGIPQEFCKEYTFPLLDRFPSGLGRDAMRPGSIQPGEFYEYIGENQDIEDLGLDKVVQIASWQPEVNWNIDTDSGKHVATVVYFTSKPTEGTNLFVTVKDDSGNVVGDGEAYIYDCPYSTLCRQVVTDSEGRILEFDLNSPTSNVNIKEKTGQNVISFERIVLIPIDEWSPDYVKPTVHCVKDRDGQCIVPGIPYPSLPDDSVMAIPTQIIDGFPARNLPRGISDRPLVYINKDNPEVDVKQTVPKEGFYVVIAEYYQPDHPEVVLKVNVTNGPAEVRGDQAIGMYENIPVYEAVLPLPTCASNRGCRAAVLQNKGDENPADFLITEEFDIQFFNNGPEGAWIEYVYTIPTEDFKEHKDSIMNPDDSIDRIERYEKECGKDNFYIPDNIEEGFCRDAVTSISAQFNSGALDCDCNADGSLEHDQCDSFGGQCQCKPNVIGRDCSRCEPEYFGFPECQQCNCPPTATCNEETGDCICAPFVTGTPDNPCSRCEENTFGYDAITGCQECNCMVDGTMSGNMSCSLESGQCYCKENVEGRACDHCTYGSYAYPHCESCDCELKGTTERICDQSNAQCFCKSNVQEGSRCDTCEEGHFNLQESNPDGCMECFCFGKTSFCSSNFNLQKTKISNMDNWSGVTFNFDNRMATKTDLQMQSLPNYDGSLDMSFNSLISTDLGKNTYYFQSGPAYSGSQLKSYAGSITYSITYSGPTNPDTKKTPDIILEGGGNTLMFFSGQKVPEYNYVTQMKAPLEPRYWVTPTGNPVERDKLMMVLNNLEHINVKGSYGSDSGAEAASFAQLKQVEMDSSEEQTEAVEDPALSIEQCQCPEGYTGMSCQLCSPGYFSSRKDIWGPICEPCNCHGHAATCHPLTGECHTMEALPFVRLPPEQTVDEYCHFNPEECTVIMEDTHCKHNTRGKFCEECDVGFYGDATVPYEDACQPCPCPLAENNFAESCDGLFMDDPAEQRCVCQPNYVGERCQYCGPGFYGEPEVPDGFCQLCSCNGNIDSSDPDACDRYNGLCQKCLTNTTGDNCERCMPWFFGDAVNAKNCQTCDCDREGTEECDHFTGQCKCMPGVEGEQCDRCMADHWGFDVHGGSGCVSCDCSEGSEYTQCDQETGQCLCKPGVRGQKCETCLNGHWNLGPNGCESCGCNTEFAVGGGCDQLTGQCVCLPKVIGQNCDGCPTNHVLIMNETRAIIPDWKRPFNYAEGCFPCSSCIEDLMVNMNRIQNELMPIMNEFLRNEASFYANQRLNYISDQIERLKPEIALLDPAVGNRKMMPLEQSMDRLGRESKSLNILYKLDRMRDLAKNAQDLETDGSNAINEMGLVGIKVQEVIKDVLDISEALGSGINPELLETSIRTAKYLLEQMESHSFSDTRAKAEEEQQAARALMEEVKVWASPVEEFKQSVMETEERLGSLEEKIVDIQNQTETANSLSREANQINFRNAAPQASMKIDRINDIREASKASQMLSDDLVNQAEEFIDQAKKSYSELNYKNDDVSQRTTDFNDRIQTYETDIGNLFSLEREAAMKARELMDQANNLEQIAKQSQTPAETAIQAASAFKNILDAVNSAEESSAQAEKDANAASEMSVGVSEKAKSALARINELYHGEDGARAASDIVRVQLAPKLSESQSNVELLSGKNKEIKQDLETINNQLEKMGDLSGDIRETKKLAEDSLKDGDDALASINARANEISNKKTVAYEVRNANSEFQLATTNIKKSLNEYEAKPDRSKRDAYVENDITTRLQRLSAKKEIIERTGERNSDLLVSIRDKLSLARKALGQINKPAVSFKRGSTLELKNPDNLEDLATKTDVSFYVSGVGSSDDGIDDGKSDERAFLFYLGNLEGTNKKIPQCLTDDYMAIQILKDGKVSLTIDIGSGPLTIESERPLKSNDWHQIEVNREGRKVNLIVRSEAGPDEITEDIITDTFPLLDNDGKPFLSGSVFNLHQEFSKIYVGGFPTVKTAVQDTVRSTDMNGKIEGLKIGGKDVGLWNYKEARYIEGANTRNKFVPKEKSELRFDGDGYVKLDPEMYYLTGISNNNIQFKFKAEQLEGLMFLAGSFEMGYLAIKLREGQIVFNYKIGADGDLVEIVSENQIELDTWYIIRAERDGSAGELFVNGESVGFGASQMYNMVLNGVTDLYFGGYPGSDYEDIQDKFFTGCIKEGSIGTDNIDISQTANITRVNAGTECTRKIQNTLSFMEASPGYVQMPAVPVNGSISVSLMFRTSATQGLLMYMRDTLDLYYISLSMFDGTLYLYAHPDIQIVTKNPQTQQNLQFNDNKWHMASITVIEEPKKIIFLQIDDFYEANSGEKANVPLLHGTEYETFFGGISDDLRSNIQGGVTENDGPFIGCIRDAIVLGEYVDFEESAGITGASLGECGVMGTLIEREPSTTESAADKSPIPVVEEKYDPIALFPEMKYGPNPPVEGECQLPVSPALDPELSIESGFRFGVKMGSFIEYIKKNLPEMMVDKSRFQVDFKTTHSDGIIFFMMNEVGKKDFIALFIKNGKLIYSFNCGSGPSYLETDFTVNDGKWHSVEFSRVDKHGKLLFDSIEVKVPDHSQYSGGSTTNLEVRPNIYLGGLDETMRNDETIKRDLQINNRDSIPGFVGCLRNLKYEHSKNGKSRMKALGTKWSKNNMVIPCSEKVESGFFFGPGGGRIRAEKRFRVGLNFDITMMIKPRNLTGVLVAVKGRRDYLILQMVDGAIQFSVDNGRGAITAVFKPNDQFEFCNGQWHEIHAVKAKNVVTLSVNKIFAQPGIGVPGVSSTDTNNPLFLGGHPRPGRFGLAPGDVNFVGCMKDVVVESNPVAITDDKIFGDIHSHVCPTI